MGEAKRRGTFEDRSKKAIAKAIIEAAENLDKPPIKAKRNTANFASTIIMAQFFAAALTRKGWR